jgi:hypothetical protein
MQISRLFNEIWYSEIQVIVKAWYTDMYYLFIYVTAFCVGRVAQ